MASEHIHQNLGEEVRSIGGYYEVIEEATLPFEDREVLYLVEIGCVETSCCGAGGIPFIFVPGYVVSWHSGRDDCGLHVSEVERITDAGEKQKIAARIIETLQNKYPHFTQVSFA